MKHMGINGQAPLNIADECTVLVNWEGPGRTDRGFFTAVRQNQQSNAETELGKTLLWEESDILRHSRNRISDSDPQNLLGKSSVWRFVKGFMIDPCPEKIIAEEPLTFVSTSLAGGKDAVPLSQCNCPNLHQLSFCFFVCVALSAPLPRESKHSLFFPGSKRSQCRRIPKFPYLFLFSFSQIALFTYKWLELTVQNLMHVFLNVPDAGWWMSNFHE